MENNPTSSRGMDRKTLERNRRNQMKALYSQLASLLPHQSSGETTSSLPDQLDEARRHITSLEAKVAKMRKKKERLMAAATGSSNNATAAASSGNTSKGVLPLVEIHEMGGYGDLEVVLTTGLDFHYLFIETISILHQQGAEIVNASFSIVDNETVFHTIHSKVGESAMGYGAAAIICERLKKLVQDAS